jgi:hypothetical protein
MSKRKEEKGGGGRRGARQSQNKEISHIIYH